MGAVTEIAQAVAESLLGSNAAGFSRAMKDRQESPDAKSRAQKRSLGNKGANDVSAPKKDIPGAVGTETARMARKGGKISRSGRVKLHKGEVVARKSTRIKSRGGRR